jgi:hypothetical protein
LRTDRDEGLKNVLSFDGWSTIPDFVRHRWAYEIYNKVRGIVVFADNLDAVPKMWQSFAVLGLTSQQNTVAIRDLCFHGVYHTPHNVNPVRACSGEFGQHPELLLGYHRFDEQQTFVYWPCEF